MDGIPSTQQYTGEYTMSGIVQFLSNVASNNRVSFTQNNQQSSQKQGAQPGAIDGLGKVNNEYLDLNELYKELHQVLHHDKEWTKSPIYPILGLLNPAYYTYDPQRGTWTPIPHDLCFYIYSDISYNIIKAVGKFISESLSISDVLSAVRGLVIDLADTLSLSDSLDYLLTLGKFLTDSVGITDTGTAKSIGKVIANNLNISDSFSRIVEYFRSFTDSVSLTEVISKGVSRFLTATVSLSDSVSRGVGKRLTDSVALAENLVSVVVQVIAKALADAVGIVESILVKVFSPVKPPSISTKDIKPDLTSRNVKPNPSSREVM